jgi:hypothetical protein
MHSDASAACPHLDASADVSPSSPSSPRSAVRRSFPQARSSRRSSMRRSTLRSRRSSVSHGGEDGASARCGSHAVGAHGADRFACELDAYGRLTCAGTHLFALCSDFTCPTDSYAKIAPFSLTGLSSESLRVVIGTLEVVFGVLALCPHYTRLSSFIFGE